MVDKFPNEWVVAILMHLFSCQHRARYLILLHYSTCVVCTCDSFSYVPFHKLITSYDSPITFCITTKYWLLWPSCGIGKVIIFLPCGFFLSSPNLSRHRLDVCHTCTHGVDLGCRSKTCCTWLSENTGRKKSPKIRHLGTIAKLCPAIYSQKLQLRHISTVGKKLVKQQCLPHMSSQYGEFRPTSGWDLLAHLGHPSKFHWLSRVGFVTAATSLNAGHSNFAQCLAV